MIIYLPIAESTNEVKLRVENKIHDPNVRSYPHET